MPVPTTYPLLPEPSEGVLLAMTPIEYAELSERDKWNYGKWEWQDVVFFCPFCRIQYTLKVKPRTEYFRLITDRKRLMSDGNRGLYFADISFWIMQISRMEWETDKKLIVKCRKCNKVFRLPTLDMWSLWGSRFPIAGVSGWNVRIQ